MEVTIPTRVNAGADVKLDELLELIHTPALIRTRRSGVRRLLAGVLARDSRKPTPTKKATSTCKAELRARAHHSGEFLHHIRLRPGPSQECFITSGGDVLVRPNSRCSYVAATI